MFGTQPLETPSGTIWYSPSGNTLWKHPQGLFGTHPLETSSGTIWYSPSGKMRIGSLSKSLTCSFSLQHKVGRQLSQTKEPEEPSVSALVSSLIHAHVIYTTVKGISIQNFKNSHHTGLPWQDWRLLYYLFWEIKHLSKNIKTSSHSIRRSKNTLHIPNIISHGKKPTHTPLSNQMSVLDLWPLEEDMSGGTTQRSLQQSQQTTLCLTDLQRNATYADLPHFENMK